VKKRKKNRKALLKEKRLLRFSLPEEIKRYIFGIIIILLAVILALSFFEKAGIAGSAIFSTLNYLIGKSIFLLPLILVLGSLVFFLSRYKKFLGGVFLAIILLILGISASLECLSPAQNQGGALGHFISLPFLKLFGNLVTEIIFAFIIICGGLIFGYLLKQPTHLAGGYPGEGPQLGKEQKQPTFFRKVFAPKFKVKEVEPKIKEVPVKAPAPELKPKELPGKELLTAKALGAEYPIPPLDLLEEEKGIPLAGDVRTNSTIIKKTLENFDIPVEMSEINIGPTVTQYTLKPADGIKLSKITTLSNDLALALASHPIRIEAPIPGKSLVGIEVPNRLRTQVRLRNLIASPQFQNAPSNLTFPLGRDVSGNPIYADLAKMPHLLVAGSTGTGKTCAADTLIFSEKGLLTFEELYSLPLNSEADFEIKVVSRDGIETTKKIYNNGICQFYKLLTSRGYQIEATTEHPLWVINEDGSDGWKPASLIKEGDYVAISRKPALFGNKTDLSDFKPSKIKAHHRKISFPQKMTPQLAQFLGLLTADGGLSIEKKGTHRVVYTQANLNLLSLYKKLLKELFGITQFIEKRSGSNHQNRAFDIVIGSKHLKEFLAYLGMNSCRSPQKVIPRAIREAPKEVIRAYLKSLFDNDGYVGKEGIELSLSSEKLISQVQIMLLNFGITSSLKAKIVKNYAQNKYFRLSIYGQEARRFVKEIGFIRKEKYEKAKTFLRLSSNPNVDLVPHISSLLKTLAHKYLDCFAHLTNNGWQYQSGILIPKYAFNSLTSYNSGKRTPSYQAMERILNFYQPISKEPEYQKLNEISKRNFYWDKVEKITQTSGVGYDFFVPGSDSFVGNGFVNHNTIFLNSLILSLLYRNSPEILRFILIDPKRVEFPVYNELPHLLCPVILESQRTVNALKWLILEMERRFDLLSEAKARDIAGYNEIALRNQEGPMPYIVLVIDELADLMAARGKEVEVGIVRLAQMARAVGIHLVVATQRPSVEVITGLIKANITSRVTFQVASQVDSRTVLDMAGAEKLLGLGDLLFVSAEISKPVRIQGAYVSEKEVKRVVNYISSKWRISAEGVEKAKLEKVILKNALSEDLAKGLEVPETEIESFYGGEDPLYEEAKRLVIEAKKASASFLQRRLRIGYARAARLIDMMEDRGVVGPADGAKPREVYLGEIQNPKFKIQNEEDNDWKKV